MRSSIMLAATAALVVGPAVTAEAASPHCEGLILKSVTMVVDHRQAGVLDPGDVFRVTYQQPVSGHFSPDMGLRFHGVSGEEVLLSHPNGDFSFVETQRSITVTVNEFDIGGGTVEYALPLPASLISMTGVYNRQGLAVDSRVSTCSKDVVLD